MWFCILILPHFLHFWPKVPWNRLLYVQLNSHWFPAQNSVTTGETSFCFFGPKMGSCNPPRSTWATQKHCLFVSSHDSNEELEEVHRKLISGQKRAFWAQKGPLWAIGAKKRPAERPNGHLPENQRYPELPQDMGDLWSHWVGSVRPENLGVT